MKYHLVVPGFLLLLWTLTEFSNANEPKDIKVKKTGTGITVECIGGTNTKLKKDGEEVPNNFLPYKDENSGEYECPGINMKIFVKFRSCDNCIELDKGSITGIIVGDVVATIVIGVAVYLIASQDRIGPITSQKKTSDRQHLVSNEASSRAPNEHYERLRPKGGQKDTYDVITNRK